MVATPELLAYTTAPQIPLAVQVRMGAEARAAGHTARLALRTLFADFDRAARLRLLPAPATRLVSLHRSLRAPTPAELPDRIEALLELADDVCDAMAAVGLDHPRKRRMAAEAMALRTALKLRGVVCGGGRRRPTR